jgi:hypothetical protein
LPNRLNNGSPGSIGNPSIFDWNNRAVEGVSKYQAPPESSIAVAAGLTDQPTKTVVSELDPVETLFTAVGKVVIVGYHANLTIRNIARCFGLIASFEGRLRRLGSGDGEDRGHCGENAEEEGSAIRFHARAVFGAV